MALGAAASLKCCLHDISAAHHRIALRCVSSLTARGKRNFWCSLSGSFSGRLGPPVLPMKRFLLRAFVLVVAGIITLIVLGAVGGANRKKLAAKMPVPPSRQLPPEMNTGGGFAAGAEHAKTFSTNTSKIAVPSRDDMPIVESAQLPRGRSRQPLAVIRNMEAPVVCRTDMVPSHIHRVMVSHVALAEPPPEAKPGTPRDPPEVIHATPEQDGGMIYRLDSTWDAPVRGPPAAASEKVPPPPNPRSR